ncbi:Armadillo-type fold [Pseudocohnilembus persalinus]|uniref:LisH domain-containing protein ARMC9 n=1 Tax=Pseudocohnilembus persalinus TaxID=266149 RepID=A0A0V0QQX0_PSEPJ|nr:Armadillo-type fold [Pseudocohnilembus persalinus]|eukprot:KRX04691.1 Armadillo-type fold [Pseudocohnilembus persalinus]
MNAKSRNYNPRAGRSNLPSAQNKAQEKSTEKRNVKNIQGRNSQQGIRAKNPAQNKQFTPEKQNQALENDSMQEDIRNLLNPGQIQNSHHSFEVINNLFHEYLLKNGMQKTLRSFQNELVEPKKAAYLKEMDLINELAKTTEFLYFYALPYITKPYEHPSLKHIFTGQWISQIRNELTETDLNYSITNPDIATQLQIQNSQNAQNQFKDMNTYNQYMKETEQNNKELLNILLKMISDTNSGIPIQQNVLVTIVDKLNKYETFLNDNLEDIIQQSQQQQIILDPQYPINSNINENIYNQHHYSTASPIHPQTTQDDEQYIGMNNSRYQNFQQLDFEKIKKVLLNQNTSSTIKCLLLQALRWRITKAKGAYIKREVVLSYTEHDLLGINEENLQQQLILNQDQNIKEQTVKLVNQLASDFYGRSYLVKYPQLVLNLIQVLKDQPQENLIRKNALGALQKLSLRRKPQIVMIEHDLIKWIVQTLKNEKDSLSEYSQEYATALFMNLSLRSLGKTKAQDPKEEVLVVLNDLLEHENMQVRTFVNGTLYSLLSRHSLREQAKAMGMGDILNYLKENSDERFKKQIQYIMDQLSQEKQEDNDAMSDAQDEDNDVDDIDEEEDAGEDDDQNDNIPNPEEIDSGEELLQKDFILPPYLAQQQENQIKELVQDQQQKKMGQMNVSNNNLINQSKSERYDINFNRPTTPSLSVSQISYSNPNYQIQLNNQISNVSQSYGQYQNQGKNINQQSYLNQVQQQQYASMQKQATTNRLGQKSGFPTSQELSEDNQGQQTIERNIPSEMQSRPKVARTPPSGINRDGDQFQYGENQSHVYDQNQQIQNPSQLKNSSIKSSNKKQDEFIVQEQKQEEDTGNYNDSFNKNKDENQENQQNVLKEQQQNTQINQNQQEQQDDPITKEIQQAFESRPKIARTPPDGHRPQQYHTQQQQEDLKNSKLQDYY